MRIGQAAEQASLEASAIRFYESAGVLPAPARSDAGYRDYDQGDVELMRFVRRLRALELPLDDVREIVRLRTSARRRVNRSATRSLARRRRSMIGSLNWPVFVLNYRPYRSA